MTEETLEATVAFAKRLADRNDAVVAITGAIDIVADRDRAYIIRNGHPQMAKVSGTSCMLSGLIAAYCGANPGAVTGCHRGDMPDGSQRRAGLRKDDPQCGWDFILPLTTSSMKSADVGRKTGRGR